MPRTFAHFNVTFTRTVEQEQTVDVAVDPELTPDIKQTVAEQLASARIKESGWTVRDRSTPQLVGSEPVDPADASSVVVIEGDTRLGIEATGAAVQKRSARKRSEAAE